jgi:predicted enzyme related to lactoylglutathione lyase
VADHIRACTPVLYVTDLAAAIRFYGLLGYAEQASGKDSEWAYAYLKTPASGLLLAAGATVPQQLGPVMLYLQVNDANAVAEQLRDTGVEVEHLGYPPHAPGGELKVADPDGYVLLLGQVTGTPPEPPDGGSHDDRSSVLLRAAEATRRRGEPLPHCQIQTRDGACTRPAEVKLADSWGDSVWACLPHGEDIMLRAPSVFLANETGDGVAAYLRHQTGR